MVAPARRDSKRSRPRTSSRVEAWLWVLAEWASLPYGRLLICGVILLLLGSLLTLASYVFRDASGQFHVYWLFFQTGALCLLVGGVWRWRAKP